MKKKIGLRYTSRDWNSIRNDLIEYAKRYYPSSAKDFNESSFGAQMIDSVAYIGDILSFYLDYQASESFLDSAVEYNNVLRHGRALGFKFRGNPSSYGIETFYIVVPAKSVGLGPNPDYLPILLKGSEFSSTSGAGFILTENVDFSLASNEVVVATVNETTGVPTSYAIKAYGQVVSGELIEDLIEVGSYEKFLRVTLAGGNISEVLSVIDSDGHEYYEVETLAQDVVFRSVLNKNADRAFVREVLKPICVPRRFVVEQERDITYLQFGYGTEDEIRNTSIIDPSEVVLKVIGKNYVTDDSFDPTKLLSTDKLGVAPSNTVLSVRYRNNTNDNSNAASNTVIEVKNPVFEFENITALNDGVVSEIVASLEVTNESPIVGSVSDIDTPELKQRIIGSYSAQNRAVTKQDYLSCIYSMPPQYGAVKRCSIVRDKDSLKRNLNLYVVSEDGTGVLTSSNDTLKGNVKTWLQTKKMINDTIDLMDAYIVNVGVEFEIVAAEDANKYAVLAEATEELISNLSTKMDIGEHFSLSKIFNILNDVDDVVDVVSVKVVVKSGGVYSDTRFSSEENMSSDGRYLIAPENVIFEIKYPQVDIRGIVK
jgi:hypothetical protein